jgi:D-xylose transport system ATP-binding protein
MADNSATRPVPGKLVLSLRGISKNFGAVSALTDIELDVHAGEVVALVGDNGAGKSTLVKVLAGVHQPSAGTIHFDGKPVTLSDPCAALDLGIATVFQDLALCENLDVVANIYLGRELNPLRLDEVAMEVVRLDDAMMRSSWGETITRVRLLPRPDADRLLVTVEAAR